LGRLTYNRRRDVSAIPDFDGWKGREPALADDARKLLDYIVRHFVLHDELVAIDLDASASDPGAEIEMDKREAVQRELARADDLAAAFADGLARADRARSRGLDEVVLDDRDPVHNRIADAMIQFLVSHQLASSRSEPAEEYHYVYYISVDWDRLRDAAADAGVDLAQAVSGGA
jgi:hypothetical protein